MGANLNAWGEGRKPRGASRQTPGVVPVDSADAARLACRRNSPCRLAATSQGADVIITVFCSDATPHVSARTTVVRAQACIKLDRCRWVGLAFLLLASL